MKRRGSVFFGVSVCILSVSSLCSPPASAQTNGPDLSGGGFGLGSGIFPDLVPLAAYWHFDEGGTATTTADSTGNGNNGTLSGDLTWVTGMFSNALYFAGTTDQYVWVQPSGTVTGSFTVCAWVQPENSTATDTLNFVSTRTGEETTFDLKLFGGTNIFADIGSGTNWIESGATAPPRLHQRRLVPHCLRGDTHQLRGLHQWPLRGRRQLQQIHARAL